MKNLEYEKEAFTHSNQYLRLVRMMKVSALVFVVLVALLLATACSPIAVTKDPVAPDVTTLAADPSQCPAGGLIVEVSGVASGIICDGAEGSPGAQGDVGATGPTGATGQAGSPGQNGSNGKDATPIVVEQVCGGITPSYPSTFPEVILVLNGKAYGVYSANDGFLAYLPPGKYHSEGIDASCNFEINADGSVSK